MCVTICVISRWLFWSSADVNRPIFDEDGDSQKRFCTFSFRVTFAFDLSALNLLPHAVAYGATKLQVCTLSCFVENGGTGRTERLTGGQIDGLQRFIPPPYGVPHNKLNILHWAKTRVSRIKINASHFCTTWTNYCRRIDGIVRNKLVPPHTQWWHKQHCVAEIKADRFDVGLLVTEYM